MRNYALLWEGKPTQVGGQHGSRAGRLVNSKGIMEVTVRCRLRKKQGRMAADRSRRKWTDLGCQRCEGSRDGRRTPANARGRQEASRREDKGADTMGRHEEGCGRNKRVGRCGEKVGRPGVPDARNKRQEATGYPGGPDVKSGCYSSGRELCPSGEKGFFADADKRNCPILISPIPPAPIFDPLAISIPL